MDTPAGKSIPLLPNGSRCVLGSPGSPSGIRLPISHQFQNGSSSSVSSPIVARSPFSSPVKERYGDRFIPTRTGNNWETSFNLNSLTDSDIASSKIGSGDGGKSHSVSIYSSLLRNEILGGEGEGIKEDLDSKNEDAITGCFSHHSGPSFGEKVKRKGRKLFTYKTRRLNVINEASSPYSLTAVGRNSQKLLQSSLKLSRKISKIPFKVLDAPELGDDFYLNLVDWSAQNVIGVGLGTCVYLWSACTSKVAKLFELTSMNDAVSSVSWSERGNFIAVGTYQGCVQIWDVAASKQVSVLNGHTERVSALAWNGDSLSSGSRDRSILQTDLRTPALQPDKRLLGHKQEVCGLEWSPDNQWLASGGNDNKLLVWSAAGGSDGERSRSVDANYSSTPLHSFNSHSAAVKAISWSPHRHGLLASGGGTADRCIKFWNTLTGQAIQSVDTGSQVCNLAWSKHTSELVSTHGYSQNQILVWKYPSLDQVAKLTGHTYRVLYLAMSPDGEAIVTGAGDETLRFWNIFSKAASQKETKSALNLFSSIR